MRVSIDEITSTITELNSLLEGSISKSLFIMLDVRETTLRVCFNDPSKTFVREISLSNDENKQMKVAVDFNEMFKAITNCQPSGSLSLDSLEFRFKDGGILTIVAEPQMNVGNEEAVYRRQGRIVYDVKYLPIESSVKSQILIRADYDRLFDIAGADEWERTNLIDKFSRCTGEKGKQVFISSKVQKMFVNYQTHLTCIPIESKALPEDEVEAFRNQLIAQGLGEREQNEAMFKLFAKVHNSAVLFTNTVNSICSILGKCKGDTIYLKTMESMCIICSDCEEERIALQIQMPAPSDVNFKTLLTYMGYKYTDYQLRFRRDALADALKYTMNTSADKTTISFIKTEDDEYNVVFACNNGECSVASEETIDSIGDLENKKYIVSPKILGDMIKQLKTPLISLDFSKDGATNSIRMGEINYEKMVENYNLVRANLSPEEPTPVEGKIRVKENSLETVQYTRVDAKQ